MVHENTMFPARIIGPNCIANETHCHCARVAASEKCPTPIGGNPGNCFMGPCPFRFKCDCEADDVCVRVSTKHYIPAKKSDDTGEEFECKQEFKNIPMSITSRTSEFHAMSADMFALFHNNEQVSYGMAGEYIVVTVEITHGDIIGVIASRKSRDEHGIKLRFRDLKDEIRTIDKNWRCSDMFYASWLEPIFNANETNWTSPSVMTRFRESTFDDNMPWMWFNNDDASNNLVFCRYKLP